MDKINQETKERINKAFEKLRQSGVKFADKVELYTMKEGDYFKGTYTGEKRKISTSYGDGVYYIFDVETGELTGRDGNTTEVKGKVGIFANKSLENLMEYDLVLENDEWKRVKIDRKNHIISCVYIGKETRKIDRKTISVAKYNFKDLTLEQQ